MKQYIDFPFSYDPLDHYWRYALVIETVNFNAGGISDPPDNPIYNLSQLCDALTKYPDLSRTLERYVGPGKISIHYDGWLCVYTDQFTFKKELNLL